MRDYPQSQSITSKMQSNSDEPAQPEFGQILARLSNLSAHIRGNAERSHSIVERAFGAAPPTQGPNSKLEVRSGQIGAFHELIAELSDVVEWQTRSIADIERMI